MAEEQHDKPITSSAEMVRAARERLRGPDAEGTASGKLVEAARAQFEEGVGLESVREVVLEAAAESGLDLDRPEEIAPMVREQLREAAPRVRERARERLDEAVARRPRRRMPPQPSEAPPDATRRVRLRSRALPVILGILALIGVCSTNVSDVFDSFGEVVPATTQAPGNFEEGFGFFGFAGAGGLELVGSADVEGAVLRLTTATGAPTAGAAWFAEGQAVSTGFSTVFWFQVPEAGAQPGEGLAFVVRASSDGALGEAGGGLGYTGIANSVAIEFDTRSSVDQRGRPDGHVAVHTAGAAPNSSHADARRASAATRSSLADGGIHPVRIVYDPGRLDVYLDDFTTPLLSVELDLEATLDLQAGTARVGFTAATGQQHTAVHDILRWQFEPLG